MADVVLKDRSGTPTTYENVEQITLNTPDGGEANFMDAALITEQVQSDWDSYDETDPAFVKNRPCYYHCDKGSYQLERLSGCTNWAKFLPIYDPDMYSEEDLANGIYFVGSTGIIKNEDELAKGESGLLPISKENFEFFIENGSSGIHIDIPFCCYRYCVRNAAGDLVRRDELIILNKNVADSIFLRRYADATHQSSTNYSFFSDKTGIAIWYLYPENTDLAPTVSYELRKLKKLDAEMLPDTVVTDLSNYYTKSETDAKLPTKLSELENDSGFVAGAALAGKEDVSNKLETYTGTDGNWSDATSAKYPSAAAVRDFVASYVSVHSSSSGSFADLYKMFIQPEIGTVALDAMTWDGNTEGLENFLGMFYKISDSTSFPDMFKIELSQNDNGTVTPTDILGTGFSHIITNGKITDLKDAFGIVIYTWDIGDGSQPFAVVSDRSGVLPAAVIEMIMGTDPGTDIPYAAGVFAYYSDGLFVSKAVSCMTVKNYIDKRLNETGGGV